MATNLTQYWILYSLVDDKSGEILEENSEKIIESTWDVLAMAKLQLQVNRQYSDTDVMIVIHHVKTVKDGRFTS